MHTNGLSDFYILGYPLVLAWFLYRKNTFNAVNLILALASVAILYSRTAYVLIVFSTLLFLVLEKKKKLLPIVVLLGICTVFLAPETVVERGLTGIEERNVQTFTAGRVENIWLPLLNDVKGDPKKLLVGSGRYSIIHSSPIWRGHAHNMYLTTFLDSGLVGLSFFVAFFVYFLGRIRKGMREVPKGQYRILLTGTLISIIAYLIAGLTGREFFPELSNSYLWIVLAIALNIIKMHRKEDTLSHET
jgi:O-antigen ligase